MPLQNSHALEIYKKSSALQALGCGQHFVRLVSDKRGGVRVSRTVVAAWQGPPLTLLANNDQGVRDEAKPMVRQFELEAGHRRTVEMSAPIEDRQTHPGPGDRRRLRLLRSRGCGLRVPRGGPLRWPGSSEERRLLPSSERSSCVRGNVRQRKTSPDAAPDLSDQAYFFAVAIRRSDRP